jgi:hypothetical protein
MDFSDADEQTGGDLIPKNTIVKVHMKVRPGGYDDPAQGWTGGVATQADSGAVYLDCEFTVMGGKYNKRKVWSLVGLHSNKGPKWGQMGRSFIRAALESARGIKPDDASDTAMKARRINSLADLDGLEFVAKVDVQAGQDGYDDKNVIQTVIPVTHREYAAAMSGAGTAPAATQGAVANKPASGGQPSWMTS